MINCLKEDLAGYAHEAWSGWMKYLFDCSVKQSNGTVVIPKWNVERWERQMNTDYNNLPENEKESDRKEAEEMIFRMRRGQSYDRKILDKEIL